MLKLLRMICKVQEAQQMAGKRVVIAQGILEGLEMGDYFLFKGVPYAQAGRFQAPRAPERWEGVFKADAFPPKCRQSTS